MDISKPIPFKTTEPILALCLRMVGVPMFVPPMNVFDTEILRKLGYRGMKLLEAAKVADERKERGRVEYFFIRTPELAHYLKVFAEQEQEINAKGNDRDASERIREVMALATRPPEDRPGIPGALMDEREALVRVFCIGFKFRMPFINQYKEWTSWLDVTKDAQEPQKIDSNTTRFFPGLKRVPVNASDKMLRQLDLA